MWEAEVKASYEDGSPRQQIGVSRMVGWHPAPTGGQVMQTDDRSVLKRLIGTLFGVDRHEYLTDITLVLEAGRPPILLVKRCDHLNSEGLPVISGGRWPQEWVDVPIGGWSDERSASLARALFGDYGGKWFRLSVRMEENGWPTIDLSKYVDRVNLAGLELLAGGQAVNRAGAVFPLSLSSPESGGR